MRSEKEILIIINEIYPKEKRCGSHLFEYGLFVKGFIEGFQKAEQMAELKNGYVQIEGAECIVHIKKTLHTNYINMHTKETEFECVKCKKIVPKNEVKQHLEDWHGEAVYLKACKECYSDYDAFTDFIEDNNLGSYY